ncbi:MAG TPA: hypothetical protein VKR58_09985 [Aquella sp.]|nr:hypothetical protein [Aquella sp.]
MKQGNVIHIVRHKQTGAEVPVIIRKMSKNNIIEEYSEVVDKRKGFTVDMLQRRWDMCKDDVIELVQDFQVPAFVSHREVNKIANDSSDDRMPIDVAIFWEEYIYGIEKKTKMPHNKLKSRAFENQTEN